MGRVQCVIIVGWMLTLAAAASAEEPVRMRVAAPLLDVRARPEPANAEPVRDPLQETQLLYGEEVIVHATEGAWSRIEAVEQPEWSHHGRWEGYPGWVESRGLAAPPAGWEPNLVVTEKLGVVRSQPKSSAPIVLRYSLGTWLRAGESSGDWQQVILLDGRDGWIHAQHTASLRAMQAMPADSRRTWIVREARLLLGDAYYWGGRAAHDPAAPAPPHRAVDCSGLVNLCYRAVGLIIPRDAHEQFLRARALPLEHAQPGDLIFLADPDHADRITHVMLYAGNGRIIEGPGTGRRVHERPLEERLQEAAGRRVACGTYLE
ncbi:MAG: C40 family peptidase [Candidatus Omnitrophica bacterium]|nr:C40 family peptidase [Candidatus Omnitrophota bacterium]